ncbi:MULTISPECIES: hypothetical protein [unclassified Bacillus (in: firmicutes)]|nr:MULTISPECIES: hypothetical protein [unclassified Bacillus (in: firmicutes)]MBT2618671.1 hypothetical protein [Bacillus sp. ISL-78]MBT2719207.1 hypothetical protein [Bacillus sp. ISL-57]
MKNEKFLQAINKSNEFKESEVFLALLRKSVLKKFKQRRNLRKESDHWNDHNNKNEYNDYEDDKNYDVYDDYKD